MIPHCLHLSLNTLLNSHSLSLSYFELGARLLATSTKESGAWLNVIAVTTLDLRMNDHTVSVAVGLRLGTAICAPHLCQHCDEEVDCYGTHGLSCCCSEGNITDILQLIPLSTGLLSQ